MKQPWPVKPLGEVATIIMGQSPPGETYNSVGDGLPFFQGKAEFRDESPVVVKWCSAPSRIAEVGDILLSVRAPVGPTNIASQRCCIGRGLAAIRAKPGVASTRYLRYFLRRFEDEIANKGVGSTFTAINRRDIERLRVPFVRFSDQRRIVHVLDAAEELRRLRAEADRRTADLIPAIFYEMFGDPATNAKGWQLAPVGRISSLVTSGFTPRGGSQVYVKEGPYFIRSQNVQMNALDVSDAARLPQDIHESMARIRVQLHDVLLNITGASIGRVAWVESLDREASVNQHVCIIRPLADVADPAYISVCLSTDFGQRMIDQAQAGASRQGLNHQQVRQIEIPLPPVRLQRQFAARVAEVRALEAQQAASRRRLDDLFQSVLHRAFRGEL